MVQGAKVIIGTDLYCTWCILSYKYSAGFVVGIGQCGVITQKEKTAMAGVRAQ